MLLIFKSLSLMKTKLYLEMKYIVLKNAKCFWFYTGQNTRVSFI
jgi:hypothetical protein